MTSRRKNSKSEGKLKFITGFLDRSYPESRIILNYNTPFQLLVATILAAQCTDERVNSVTEGLFERYPDPLLLSQVSLDLLMEEIKPTGFYRNKARAISSISKIIMEGRGGNVPDNMDDLTALPGVGRKTANVILGECFGQPAIPVDTHVKRVSNRLGLSSSKDPDVIEEELSRAIPRLMWWNFSTRLGWHGRKICKSRKPLCEKCGLDPVCPRIGV